MVHRFLIAFATVVVVGTLAAAGLFMAMKYQVEGEYFDSNGVPIHYTVDGEGEPVILIHGLAVNSDINWRRPFILQRLAKDYKVIAMDVRGHGLSGAPHDPAKYGTECVTDVVRLMDHLGIEKAHVIGYSMGGFIALKMAIMYPDRLLCSIPCAAGWERADGENMALLAELVKSLKAHNTFYPLTKKLEPEGKEPPLYKVMGADIGMDILSDLDAMEALVEKFPEFAVTEEELRANRTPVLTIVGSKDPLKSGVDAMTGVMANHEAIIIEGGDHMTTTAYPEFLDGIRSFLKKNSATPVSS